MHAARTHTGTLLRRNTPYHQRMSHLIVIRLHHVPSRSAPWAPCPQPPQLLPDDIRPAPRLPLPDSHHATRVQAASAWTPAQARCHWRAWSCRARRAAGSNRFSCPDFNGKSGGSCAPAVNSGSGSKVTVRDGLRCFAHGPSTRINPSAIARCCANIGAPGRPSSCEWRTHPCMTGWWPRRADGFLRPDRRASALVESDARHA